MEISCRHFSGYKPCGLSTQCNSACSKRDIPQTRALLIQLGALGAVVRATSLLPTLHRHYPGLHLTWITDNPAHQLLQGNPLIDRVLTTSESDLLSLSALNFDVAFILDKSLKASGVFARTRAKKKIGFFADSHTGAILPLNSEAQELWELGLDNHKKFFVNQKPETQLMAEALGLPWQRDEYQLNLSAEEKRQVIERRSTWSGEQKWLVGINTGCAATIPYKKLTVERHREIIQELVGRNSNVQVVLLGGREDTVRNRQIAESLPVILSDTEQGLRDGLISMAAMDVVLTGDSLGLHLAIALKKSVVAWFGPTCAHEIDLYGRGVALKAEVPCSPCWQRHCQKSVMCYDQVAVSQVVHSLEHFLRLHQTQKSALTKLDANI